VINPYSKYITVWNMIMTAVYLVSLFMDTLILAFHLYPLLNPSVSNWNTILGTLMLIDITLKFFIAFRATQSVIVEEDDCKEKTLLGKLSSKVAASTETSDGLTKKQQQQAIMNQRAADQTA